MMASSTNQQHAENLRIARQTFDRQPLSLTSVQQFKDAVELVAARLSAPTPIRSARRAA